MLVVIIKHSNTYLTGFICIPAFMFICMYCYSDLFISARYSIYTYTRRQEAAVMIRSLLMTEPAHINSSITWILTTKGYFLVLVVLPSYILLVMLLFTSLLVFDGSLRILKILYFKLIVMSHIYLLLTLISS